MASYVSAKLTFNSQLAAEIEHRYGISPAILLFVQPSNSKLQLFIRCSFNRIPELSETVEKP